MTRLITLTLALDLDNPIDLAAVTNALAPYYTLTPAAPVVVAPPPSGLALAVVISQNGVDPLWTQDYSYAASDIDDKVDAGDGNPNCVKVTVLQRWGGYQPSNPNGKTTDFSHVDHIAISLKATIPGQVWSVQFLQAGDKNIPGSGVRVGGTDATYGPASKVGEWTRYLIPKALLMTDHSGPQPLDVSGSIYKGAVQDQTGSLSNVFYVDNWGGV